MASPRVLVLSHMFPRPDDPRGGPFVHEQVRSLRIDQGLDVRVVSGWPHPLSMRRPHTIPSTAVAFHRRLAGLRWEEWDGVPVAYFPYWSGAIARWTHEAAYRDGLLRAVPWIRRTFPFDLMHAHTANWDGYAALSVRERTGVPYVLTEHTNPFRILLEDPRTRRQSLAGLTNAERIWCVSPSLQAQVCEALPAGLTNRVDVLFNGVDVSRFTAPAAWRPDPTAPRLLYVGLFLPYKNLPVLVDAMTEVRRQVPGATLELVGDGPLRGDVEAQIRRLGLGDAIRCVGTADRAEVARRMHDECDILVLPSKSETFGVVAIEALASGKPVVATKSGGPECIVTDPAVGALCEKDDPAALARALIATIRRLPTFDADSIRRFACERFDFRIVSGALADAYRAIRQRAAA